MADRRQVVIEPGHGRDHVAPDDRQARTEGEQEPAHEGVAELDRLLHALAEIVTEDAIADWLEAPNDALKGGPP